MKRIHLYILCGLLLLSCQKTKDKKIQFAQIDLAGTLGHDISNNLAINDLVKQIRIIPVNTTDSTLLRYLFFADVIQNNIVIYDKESVFLINKTDGNVKKIINNVGQGPGEYTFIMNLVADNENIRIFDTGKKGFLKFDYSGKFIDFYKNDSIGTFRQLPDEDDYYAACYSPYSKPEYFVSIYDTNWNYIRSGIKNDRKEHHLAMYYWNSVNHNNGKLLFKDCFGDTIYQITAEKDIPYLVLNKGKYKMPLEIASTLDILYKEGHHYIQQDYCIIASRYCFLSFNYDNKRFYDIWDMPDSRLVYRNIVQSQRDAIGFPVKLNDKTIHVWIDFAKDNLIYCVVSPEDALELIPTLPEDTNPVILEIELI